MWELHAVHHSQRQLSFWSDDRNHLLDDIIRGALFALLGIALGVPPAQFVAVLMLSRLLQSVQHANIRLPFGPILERVLVSPSFHRRHHAIGIGHEGHYQGCNFGVLFPWWDMLLRTADFRAGFVETGIRDQLSGRDYGAGFWAQQCKAIARIAGRA
jgi:sterol desaturase/sphingolipid hydroxylase (fatty acid hydroxylase superfamily)